jgi:hypothetical protein
MHARLNRSLPTLGACLLLALLGACNSDLDNNTGTTTTTASATGIWSGTDSVSGLGITAYINSAGEATFVRADGIQFTGTVQISGDTLAVTVDGYSDFGNTFSDGSTYGIGTLNGTVSTGASLTATLSFTTNGNTALTGNWSLTFQSLSNTTSSDSAVAANYTNNVTGEVLSITTTGTMTSQNANNNCVLNGTISTSDSSHDIYEVSFQYEDCTGSYAALNGVQFTGLAVLNSTLSTPQLSVVVTGASSTAKYGIVATYNAS